MKKIGIIQGLDYKLAPEYWRKINRGVVYQAAVDNTANIIMEGVNRVEIISCIKEENWPQVAQIFIDCAKNLEKSGADCFLICDNAMHRVANRVEASNQMHFLHIARAVLQNVRQEAVGIKKIGLLGRSLTAQSNIYQPIFQESGIEVIAPSQSKQEAISIIIANLVAGVQNPGQKQLKEVIDELVGEGAQGFIIACPELAKVIDAKFTNLPLFNSIKIHINAAVEYALAVDRKSIKE